MEAGQLDSGKPLTLERLLSFSSYLGSRSAYASKEERGSSRSAPNYACSASEGLEINVAAVRPTSSASRVTPFPLILK